MIRYCIWDVGKTIYDYSLEPLERWIAARTADPEKFRSGGGLRAYGFDPYMLGKIDTREMCREICERFGVPYTGETPGGGQPGTAPRGRSLFCRNPQDDGLYAAKGN